MFRLNYMTPETATNGIKEIYDNFPKETGPPHPLQLMSASPGFLEAQYRIIQYFGNHPSLSFQLMSAIRLIAADIYGYDYCVNLNQTILSSMGATAGDLEVVLADVEYAPFEADEKAMLGFVRKAIQAPDTVRDEDVETLRSLGWQDADILDALAHGAFMKGHAVMMKAFGK